MGDKLTAREERFCIEYLVDLNATQAAIRAKYSKKTAGAIGSENLKKPHISARIKELQFKVAEKIGIDINWITTRFKEISDRCMQAVPVMEFDATIKMMDQKTNDEGKGVWEFDSSGANKATELLGKHIGYFEVDNSQKQPINLIGSTEFKITRRKKQ